MNRPLLGPIYGWFFAPEAPEDRVLPVWAKYALPLLCFVVVWTITWSVLHYRIVTFIDDQGYIATAEYVRQHGHLPTEDNPLYRQFPGQSLLMIVANVFTGNMRLAGHVVVAGSAVLAIVLVQYLFNDFRLTIIFSFFFPWWITTTTALFSEPPIVLCFLLSLWTVRDARPFSAPWFLGLLAAGYGIIIRQTALFLILPFLAVYTFRREQGNLMRTSGAIAVSLLPFVLYLTWNWVTIHELFPQVRMQHALMVELDQSADHRYSGRTIDIPFKGMVTALTDPGQSRGKKADVLLTLALVLVALTCLARRAWRNLGTPEEHLAGAFAAALLIYFLFHMSIGGVSSFRYLERYLCPCNAIIDWALFYRRPLRWPWIILLLVYSVLFDFSVHIGQRSLGFIK